MALRALWAVLAAIGGLVACDPSANPTCLPPVVTTTAALRVMPLGDSITAGVGSSTGGGYRLPLWRQLAGRTDVEVDFVGSEQGGGFADSDHEGHSGYMIDQIRARIDGWLADSQPDVVLLHLGVNDLDRGDRFGAADRLVTLVDQIERDQPGVTVIVQGLIPTTGGLQGEAVAFNAMVRSEADSHGFRWVEPPELGIDEMADRLHPSDQGYRRIAEGFYDAMGQVGEHPMTPQGACHPSP